VTHILKVKELLNGILHGNENIYIEGPCSIKDGKVGFISYIKNAKYSKYLNSTLASVIIVDDSIDIPEDLNKTIIKVENAPLAFIKYLNHYSKTNIQNNSIDKSAIISSNAKINSNAYIGKNVIIEDSVKISKNCKIDHNTYIGKNCIINEGTVIRQNTTIHSNTQIGKNCKIKSNSVIGSSGFGLYTDKNGLHHHIPHVGNVIIYDDVMIGSSCTIDRGTISSTSIGKGTKFDNQVHIGHNVHIGKHCIISAQVAIGGSTKIYNNVILGGQSGIIDNLEIHDNAIVGPKSFIVKSVKEGSYVSGNPAMPHKDNIKKNIFLSKLPEIYKDLLK